MLLTQPTALERSRRATRASTPSAATASCSGASANIVNPKLYASACHAAG